MHLLFQGGRLLTCVRPGEVLDADIRIRDGRIEEIGPSLPSAGATIVGVEEKWLLPSFCQSHIHLCQTLFRGMAEDRALLEWLGERIWPLEAAHDQESVYWSAQLGVAELLLGGTTSFLDMGTLHHTDSIFQACLERGVRATSGRALMDRENPAGLHALTDENLKGACDEADRWHGVGRLRYAFAPRFVPSCTEDLLRGCANEARSRGCLIHTHASENTSEIDLVRHLTGRANIEYLHDIGLLGEDVALAHCIHLTDTEKQLLADTGTRVSHCPSSNMKLASGIAPVPELHRSGAHVSLGADGAPCNNRLDAFAEMRKAGLLQSLRLGPGQLGAADILQMATLKGAEALGIDDIAGSLEVGKEADLIVIDSTHPGLLGGDDPIQQIVYSGGPEHIESVYLAGERVVHQGRLIGWDLTELAKEVRAAARRVQSRALS